MSYVASHQIIAYLKKSLIVLCSFDLIGIFSTFVVNETTHRKSLFSASCSLKKSCNLSRVSKASPEITAGFQLISIASSTSSSKSEPSLSDLKYRLITD